MVPVISVLLLGGRCRSCGAAIPDHLLRIEVAATFAAALAIGVVPGAAELALSVAFLWVLIGQFYCDLLYFRLPDPLTFALFVLGLGLAFIDPSRSLGTAVLSAAVASASFLLIRWVYAHMRGREGLGLGDVKLMAGVGAAVGWADVPVVTLIAAVLALLVVLLDLLRGNAPKGDAPVPFGSYLCAATALVVVM